MQQEWQEEQAIQVQLVEQVPQDLQDIQGNRDLQDFQEIPDHQVYHADQLEILVLATSVQPNVLCMSKFLQ